MARQASCKHAAKKGVLHIERWEHGTGFKFVTLNKAATRQPEAAKPKKSEEEGQFGLEFVEVWAHSQHCREHSLSK